MLNNLLNQCKLFAKLAQDLEKNAQPSLEDEQHFHEMLTRILGLLTFEEYSKAIKFLIEFDQVIKNFDPTKFESTFLEFINDDILWNKIHTLENTDSLNTHDIKFLQSIKDLIIFFDNEKLLNE